MRTIFYFNCTLAQDEDVQRQGIVLIMFIRPCISKQDTISTLKEIGRVRAGFPRKMAGVHVCFENASVRPFVSGLGLVFRQQLRNRMRSHFGTLKTIKFELQTYGISTDNLPASFDGSATTEVEWHQQWLQGRRSREEKSAALEDMIIPRRFDCLFGRGQHTRNHTGNVRAAHLVDMYREQYENASKLGKTAIAERIVNIIRESHGRFLKWEDDGWVGVDAHAARNKVCVHPNCCYDKVV